MLKKSLLDEWALYSVRTFIYLCMKQGVKCFEWCHRKKKNQTSFLLSLRYFHPLANKRESHCHAIVWHVYNIFTQTSYSPSSFCWLYDQFIYKFTCAIFPTNSYLFSDDCRLTADFLWPQNEGSCQFSARPHNATTVQKRLRSRTFSPHRNITTGDYWPVSRQSSSRCLVGLHFHWPTFTIPPSAISKHVRIYTTCVGYYSFRSFIITSRIIFGFAIRMNAMQRFVQWCTIQLLRALTIATYVDEM